MMYDIVRAGVLPPESRIAVNGGRQDAAPMQRIYIIGVIDMKLLGFYILSKNVPDMVEFYKKVLRADSEGEGNHIVINLPDGKGRFPIWDNGEVSDIVNERLVLWFQVENVDDEYNNLLKMNVQILEPPVNNPWGGRHMVFCDPDGNRVRFVTYTK